MLKRQPSNIQPKSILVITLRYLGDALLVTPLISSLKAAYPQAGIDVLLPSANIGMLEGNPDIRRLIAVDPKPSLPRFIALLFSLFRRYDLAISTQGGDRPAICAIVAGKRRMGMVPANTAQYSWKRLLLHQALAQNEPLTHSVLENLKFCEYLHIEPRY
jgi:heptosyltransferase-3